MSREVISVRVNRQLKQEATRLGVDLRVAVEEALENAIEERKRETVSVAIEEVKRLMNGVSEEQWVKNVRKSREMRRTKP